MADKARRKWCRFTGKVKDYLMIEGLNFKRKVKISAALTREAIESLSSFSRFCANKNANGRWKEEKVTYIPEFHARLYCLIVKLEYLL